MTLCSEQIKSDERNEHYYECLLIRSLLYNIFGSIEEARKDANQVLDSLTGEGLNFDDAKIKEVIISSMLCNVRGKKFVVFFGDFISENRILGKFKKKDIFAKIRKN